ncbi:8285_t:CDS:2, partial [Racocetra persica]
MADLQLILKAIRDFFDETPVEEWSYIHFLETFKPVIILNLDIPIRDEKATWRKRFIKRLEKIADDDAYNKRQRNKAIRLKEKLLSMSYNQRTVPLPPEDPQSADLFWKNIEKEKEIIRRRQEVENDTELIRNNTEKDALKLLETARTEQTKKILNSLKRKSEDKSSAKKRYKLPGSDSEYYKCSDSGESDAESINEVHDDEEIKNLSQDEMDIRNKLLKILTANKEKDKKAGKDFMKSIFLNNILDLSDDETYKQIKKSLSKDQSSWLEGVLQKKTWKPTPEYTQYINQFTEEACTRNEIPTIAYRSFVSLRFDPYYHEAHDIAQHILTHFSIRLEAPTRVEYKGFNLERTYAVDTIIYILNRIFRMHQDELDVACTTGNNQVIIIIEFSRGRKTPISKKDGDLVKLCRNAMRTLNVLLKMIPRERARIYLHL